MPFIKTEDGAEIYYEDSGRGFPIIFVHGWGSSRDVWKRQIAHFSSEWRTISLDLRAHGESKEGQIASREDVWESLEQDMIRLVRALRIDQAIWVGWSLGAALGLSLAIRREPWISGMVLAGASPSFVAKEAMPFGLEPEAVGRIRKNYQKNERRTLAICFQSFFSGQEQSLAHELVWNPSNFILPRPNGALEILDAFCAMDVRDKIGKINIPTFLCHGTGDEVCWPEGAMFLQQRIPNARLELFEGAGHAVFLTEAERFNRSVERFCRVVASQKQLNVTIQKMFEG